MRSLGTRRAALAAGAATVAVLALGGCSAGQVAETAVLDTPISGVDRETLHASVFIRNLMIPYNGIHGYEAGSDAPIELSLYNQTDDPITVAISSKPTQQAQVVSAEQVGIGPASTASAGHASESPAGHASESPEAHGSAAPGEPESPGASAEPTVPAVQIKPARVTLPAQGSALFRPTDRELLQVFGLSDDLVPGTSVNLVFEFSDGSPALELQAPVGNPLEPAPRVSAGGGEAEGH
ncbi:hypothetical protein [Actinoplanes aureus]|uniref:Copper chaperone PCu(A)C n=1 Tax=Actinoplanes aureus TaxID=2792083 RepID=A0A931G869_9ACTN|nr:hypothetical protein [Actinoplanes aureus]MBG0568949.1 hypothetical protein [Actinoplanes aureus]